MASKTTAPSGAAPDPLPALDLNQRYSVEESIRYLRTSRATLYAMISSGAIKTITQGRRRYLPGAELARMAVAS
jgi:excisionase family DNA binding protein